MSISVKQLSNITHSFCSLHCPLLLGPFLLGPLPINPLRLALCDDLTLLDYDYRLTGLLQFLMRFLNLLALMAYQLVAIPLL